VWPLSRGQIFRSLYGPVLPVLKTSNNTAKLVMALTLLLQCVAASGTEAQAEPGVAVRAWVLTDAEGGEILAGENASKRLLSSSTDKIMVVLVALRMVEAGEASLEDEITVSPETL
jgi:D-alanyl-D-alanine carboxypeptidase